MTCCTRPLVFGLSTRALLEGRGLFAVPASGLFKLVLFFLRLLFGMPHT